MERPRDDAERPASGPAPLDGLRVLVVDDIDDIRELLAKMISRAGARVRTARSAVAALAAVEEETPDLIVTDLGMPDVDGFELLERVRALPRGRDVRVIALTGFAGVGYRERCLAAGFADHLAKPIDLKDLIASIGGAVGRAGRDPRGVSFPLDRGPGDDVQACAI